MDVLDRIIDVLNSTNELPIKVKKGYLSNEESCVIYPLPNSKETQIYMDGTRDIDLIYEVAMKSKDGNKLEQTLWQLQDRLDQLKGLESQNNSFEFGRLTINSKPYINDADEQGWLTFLLDFTVSITTIKEEI